VTVGLAPVDPGLMVNTRLFTDDLQHLAGGRCGSCRALMFPTRRGCPECGSVVVRDVALADGGAVWTFTVLTARPPGYAGPCPYALAVVELDDGLRITSIVTAEDPEEVRIGDRVRFEVIDVGAQGAPRFTFAHRRQAGR
jgi:hypothetical protein